MAGAAKRVNISLPEEVHKLLQELAEKHYGGNLSRFLTDAGVYFAGRLEALGKSTRVHVDTVGSTEEMGRENDILS
jgi:hypothetical protein